MLSAYIFSAVLRMLSRLSSVELAFGASNLFGLLKATLLVFDKWLVTKHKSIMLERLNAIASSSFEDIFNVDLRFYLAIF